MPRIQLTELSAFVAVAEHRSFTKAAAQVGIALPTMSQTIRSLEERLGIRLFNRTTRSVALTEAGERLLREVQPVLEGLDRAVESVNTFREKPMGTLRLMVARPISTVLLAPLIEPFLARYPEIHMEVCVDDTRSDLLGGRFDAGIHVGHKVDRDMTVLRLFDDFRMIAVASPAYLARQPAPQSPKDLHAHNCIQFRSAWDGAIQQWCFNAGNKQVDVEVEGSLVVNDIDLLLCTTISGVGIGYLPEPILEQHLAKGELVRVLDTWSGTLPGIFLYHPSRHQTPMPLRVFLNFVEEWRRNEQRIWSVA